MTQEASLDSELLIKQMEIMTQEVMNAMNRMNKNVTDAFHEMNASMKTTIDNFSTLNESTDSFDIAQSAITSTISSASSALGFMSTALSLAKDKQALLNLEVLMNPYVAAAAAIGTFIGMLSLLGDSISAETQKHQETMNKIKDEISTRDELHAKQQEQMKASLSEADNVANLSQELSTLVDQNGKVKDGYEDRANFIVDVLNQALGTQMKMENGVVDGYIEADKAIENKVAKLKAEAILEAQLPAYKEALLNATNAQIEADKLHSEFFDLKMQKASKEAELQKKYGEDWYNQALKNSDVMLSEWATLSQQTKNKEAEYQKQTELTRGYYDDISAYETNAALIASGNADNYAKVQMDSAVTKAESVDEIKNSLASEIQAENERVDYLKELRAAETDASRQQQIDAQIAAAELQRNGYQTELDNLAEKGEKTIELEQQADTDEMSCMETSIAAKQAKLLEMYTADEAQRTEEQQKEAEALQSSIDNDLAMYSQFAADKINTAVELKNGLHANSTEAEINAAEAAQREAINTLHILGQSAVDKMNIANDLRKRRDANEEGITNDMVLEAERQAVIAETKFGEVADKVSASWNTLPSESREAFKNVMEPMITEMEKKKPSLFSTASDIAYGILDRLRKSFDINSPSRKVKKIFGYVMEGAKVGLEEHTPDLLHQTEEISTDILHKFTDLNSLDLQSLSERMKGALMEEQYQMQGTVDVAMHKDLILQHRLQVELPEIKGTLTGNIENHILMDGRETAVQLTPFISEELAFYKG